MDETFELDFKPINPNATIRSKFFRDVLRDFRKKPELLKDVIKYLMLLKIRDKIRGFNTKYEKHKSMDERLRKELTEKFK